MLDNNELNKVFHNLSKNIRRQRLILDLLSEKHQAGYLKLDCEEMRDFSPTMREVEDNFNKLEELLKGSQK